MSVRIGVAVMAVLLLGYIALVGWRAVVMVQTGEPVAIAMGVALIVLPLLAVWGLGRELWFGVRAERLGRRLEAEGGLPDDVVTTSPSGRVSRADGDAVFPRYREEVERHPDDWRAWFRLSLAYDAAGDRRRARGAVREAIRRER
ncbi:tetratricopeptide repeat protein [Microbacterium marinilacus]|uniref:Tetratricopeptide repeat protein n=1 Tax=Microbacterium marinilacus TaxID=415209 RepID=A0ABP7BPR5_9MICO|nr:tetratricopeptide repeat protein [Microbacterium marinilacus]MBY0689858.1 hypothetical protein [Microbacterium marinilacus]